MVDFARGGEEVKMSGRSGDFIALDDVIAEVGADALFTYLMQSVDGRQTFDLEGSPSRAWTTRSSTSVCPRSHHLDLRQGQAGVERSPLADVDTSLLVHERELDCSARYRNYPTSCGWRVSTTLRIASPRGA